MILRSGKISHRGDVYSPAGVMTGVTRISNMRSPGGTHAHPYAQTDREG